MEQDMVIFLNTWVPPKTKLGGGLLEIQIPKYFNGVVFSILLSWLAKQNCLPSLFLLCYMVAIMNCCNHDLNMVFRIFLSVIGFRQFQLHNGYD